MTHEEQIASLETQIMILKLKVSGLTDNMERMRLKKPVVVMNREDLKARNLALMAAGDGLATSYLKLLRSDYGCPFEEGPDSPVGKATLHLFQAWEQAKDKSRDRTIEKYPVANE
jgi:hypothetical protein